MNNTISTGTKPESLATLKNQHAQEFIEAWHSTRSINKHIDLEPAYEPIRNTTIQATSQRRNQPPPQPAEFRATASQSQDVLTDNATEDLYKRKRNGTSHFTQGPAEDVT